MEENLRDYMTDEEREMVDALLDKAQARMYKKQAASREHQFLFLGCQCECHEGMVQQKQDGKRKADFETDLQQLLQQICDFCKRHRICFGEREMAGEREEDDDLPF